MKIVYIAHPIGGDVEGNLKSIFSIIREINLKQKNIVPFAPYVSDVKALDDKIPEERSRGFKNNKEFFDRMTMDEVWLYGSRISQGMRQEVLWAIEMGIPIYATNYVLRKELESLKVHEL